MSNRIPVPRRWVVVPTGPLAVLRRQRWAAVVHQVAAASGLVSGVPAPAPSPAGQTGPDSANAGGLPPTGVASTSTQSAGSQWLLSA